VVFGHQKLQGLVEEGTRTTSRIANGELQQPCAVLFQLGIQLFDGAFLTAFTVFSKLLIIYAYFGFFLLAQFANRIVYYVFGDVLGRVEYAIFLALGFALVYFFACQLRTYILNIIQTVLKYVPKYVGVYLTGKIVVGEFDAVLFE
jgi:hypothetical protein